MPIMKWFYYKIDYEYGFAYLWTKKKAAKPRELFFDLADKCFGIRKSIGTTEIVDQGQRELPGAVETPKTPMGADFSRGRAGIASSMRYAFGIPSQGFQRRPRPDAMPSRQQTL